MKYFVVIVKLDKDEYTLGPYSTVENAHIVAKSVALKDTRKGRFALDGCAWRRRNESICVISKHMDMDFSHYAQQLHDIENGTEPELFDKLMPMFCQMRRAGAKNEN